MRCQEARAELNSEPVSPNRPAPSGALTPQTRRAAAARSEAPGTNGKFGVYGSINRSIDRSIGGTSDGDGDGDRSRPDVVVDEVLAFAEYLGMNPVAESDLLWIAEAARNAELEPPWVEETDGAGQGTWSHTGSIPTTP